MTGRPTWASTAPGSWARAALATLALAAWASPAPAQPSTGESPFTEEVRVSKRAAFALSLLAPGLGQMARGHEVKGGILLFTELVLVTVAVDAHESYKTRLEVYDEERAAYEALRVGGNWAEAEARFVDLRRRDDDLDGLHRRRLAFALPAAAVYVASLIDVLLEPDGAEGRRWSATPMVGPGRGGVALWHRF